VHLDGHASHSCLLLLAISAEPSQTPLPSVPTQLSPSLYWPFPQMMQSFDVGPEQVLHEGEHALHAVPSENEPSGQTVPDEVVPAWARHWVLSFAFWVKPCLHWRHVPVPSAHEVHPSWQTWQSPLELRKNPVAHFAHAVPLSAFVQPALQVHDPPEPHWPFRQLQVLGAFSILRLRQVPEPAIPSSHWSQSAGQA